MSALNPAVYFIVFRSKVQNDLKVSLHTRGNWSLYLQTCTIRAHFHWRHIRMRLSHYWRTHSNTSAVMLW